MKLLYLITSLILIITLSSCAKKTEKFSEREAPKQFGVSNTDSDLNVNIQMQGLKPAYINQNNYVVQTEDILQLAEYFSKSDHADLKEKALALYSQVVIPGITSTYMTPQVVPAGSPYVEQAYLFLKPFLISQYSHILQKSQNRVEQAADKIPKPIESGLSAKSYLEFIIFQLRDFNKNLLSMSETDTSNFINPVTKKINDDYIKPLNQFIPHTVWLKDRNLSVYLNQLHDAVKHIPGLTDQEKKISQIQIQEALDYAKQNDEVKDGYTAFNLIIDMWINKAQRQRSPKILADLFKKYNDKQLLALATNNQPLLDANAFEKLKSRKDFDKMTDKELIALYSQNIELLKGEEWVSLTSGFSKSVVHNAELREILSVRGVPQDALENTKLHALVAYWLNLKIRYLFPDVLVAKLSEFNSDKDLEKLKDTSWWNYSILRSRVIDFIEAHPNTEGKKPSAAEEGVANFKNFISTKINYTVETTLKTKIYQLASNLKFMVRDEVIYQLEAQKAQFPKLVFEDFNKYAGKYLKEWFFKHKTQISLFEVQEIEFNKVGAHWLPQAGSIGLTSSRLIAQSLLFAHTQLQSQLSTEEKNKFAYQVVNKLSAISGYVDYNMELVDSVMVPLVGDKNKKFNIRDIQNYNPFVTTFAVPDKVYLSGQFKTLSEKMSDQNQVSVLGQMKLLRAYTQLLNWFKTWQSSSFDHTLNPLRLNEFPSQDIFPKKELFKQTLALSLSILKNLSARMTGLYSQSGEFTEGLKTEKARGAVVYGFDSTGGMIKIVKTQEVAETIIAISNFYLETQDLFQFDDADIKKALPEIESARKQLKSLLVGLTLFASGKLMLPDAGYVTGFNLQTQRPIMNEQRNLQDQLAMQRAYLKAAEVLKSDLLKIKAIENYYFINKVFWNSEWGFYNEYETRNTVPGIKILSLMQALETLKMVSLALNEFTNVDLKALQSLRQAFKLQEYWNTRLIAGFNRAQTAVELVNFQQPVLSPKF